MSARLEARSATRRQLLRALGAAGGLGVVGVGGLPALARADTELLGSAPPPEIATAPTPLSARGHGRLTFFGLHIYDARLWVAEGFDPAAWDRRPIALELVYARRLVGRQIAERSLQEMQRVPGITGEQASAWLATMNETFPDVSAGTRLTGLLLPASGLRFFYDGRLRREVSDESFARRFVGIWLAPQTSQPRLREALLGVRA